MASLAQNVGENPQHVPWNNNDENNNTEFKGGRQNMMGFSCMNFLRIHWLSPWWEKYRCLTRKPATRKKKNYKETP